MNSPDATPPDDRMHDLRMNDLRNQDEWMDARVEAYVDGALPPAERAHFEHVLSTAPRWQRAADEARTVRHVLRALPLAPCPAHVTDDVLLRTRREQHVPEEHVRAHRAPKRHVPDRKPLRRGRPHVGWRPVAAMGVLAALVVCAALLGRPAAPPSYTQSYTEAEVETAREQVEWTLAYLAHVGQRTGEELDATLREATSIRQN